MLIKYNFEVGHKIDNRYTMIIQVEENKIDFLKHLSREKIIEYLKRDKVDVEKIDSLKYYNSQYNGWFELRENQTIELREKVNDTESILLRIKLKYDLSNKCKLQEIISSFENRVLNLEEKLKKNMLNSPNLNVTNKLEYSNSNLELDKNISSFNLYNHHEFLKNQDKYSKIDVCFLFSNPIISEKNDKITSMTDPIDFEKELQNLEKTLSDCGKKIKARFEVANLENISSVLAKKPKILHISCHGSYEEGEHNKFYLNFEDNLGKLDKFDTEKLQNLLRSNKSTIDSQIKVVFVSACYSEPIAEIFKSAGIPAVICVQSQTQVLDEAAEGFGQYFYKSLFEGNTIKNSYEYAKTMMSTKYDKKSKYTPCCCFHKHKDDCIWKLKSVGRDDDAHLDHLKTCNCKKNESHIHNKECFWVNKFIEKYNPKIEVLKDENLIKVCCCSPEIAHDESKKFLIKIDKNYENERIFGNIENGSLEIKNKNCCFNLKFSVDVRTSLIGRNIELYNIIKILCEDNNIKKYRIVTVYGSRGIGKQTFVKMVGRYAYERKYFPDGVIFIDNKNDMNERKIVSQIALNLNNFKFDYLSMENFFNTIKNLKILIIFYYSKKYNNFPELIKKIVSNTNKPKILVAGDEPLGLFNEYKFQLLPLSEFYSAKLLITIANDFLPRNLKNDLKRLAKDELVKISQGIPSIIYKIAGLLMENRKNDNIIQKIREENSKKKGLSDGLMELILKNVSANNQQSIILEILYMLYICPQGLLEENIFMLFQGNNEIMTIIDKLHNSGQIINKSFLKEFNTICYTLNKDLKQVVCKLCNNKELKKHVESQLTIFYSQLLKHVLKSININTNIKATEFSASNDSNLWHDLDTIVRQESRHSSSSMYQKMYCESSLKPILQEDNYKNIDNSNLILKKGNLSHLTLTELPKFTEIDENLVIRRETTSSFDLAELINPTTKKQEPEFNKSLSHSLITKNSFGYKPMLSSSVSYHFDNFPNSEQRFFHEEDNIYSLISFMNLKDLHKDKLDDNIKSVIESITITILTILRIFYRYDDCLDQINNFIKISEHFSLNLNKARLYIFAISLFPKLIKLNLPLNLRIEHIPSFNYEQAFTIIFDLIVLNYKQYPGLLGEAFFCKAITNYEMNNENNKNITNILTDLETAKKYFQTVGDSYGSARVSFIIANYSIENKRFDEKVLDNYKHAMSVFELYKKNSLVIECLIGISKWYYGIYNHFEAKTFAKQALIISSNLKNNKLEYQINELLSSIYDQIRKQSKNVFVFIKAFQLVRHKSNQNINALLKDQSSEIIQKLEAIKPVVNFPNDFRLKLMETFVKSNKEIHIKFDFLTYKNFEDIIEKGGRFLCIGSDVFNDNGSLFVEGDHGEAVEITRENLESMLNKSKIFFDLVVLIIPQSRKLGHVFIECGVQHVICFELDQTFLDCVIESPLINFNNLFTGFTYSLIKELLNEKSVREATKISEREFNSQLKNFTEKLLFNNVNNKGFTSVGEGVVLLQKESKIHDINIFGNSDESILLNGSLLDLSKLRAKLINIDKRINPFVGLKRELFICVSNLANNKDIHISGIAGIGKTAFSKEIAYYLYVRNYFRDGIFYFDLKEHSSTEKLTNIFNEHNLFSSIKENKKFCNIEHIVQEDHRILIIFDNCDKIMKNSDNQFQVIINSLLPEKEKKTICFVLITNSSDLRYNNFEAFTMPYLSIDESVHFFLAYLEKNISREEIDSEKSKFSERDNIVEDLMSSERINACNGIPKYIKLLSKLCKTKDLKRIKFEEFAPKNNYLKLNTCTTFKGNFSNTYVKKPTMSMSSIFETDKSKEYNNKVGAINTHFLKNLKSNLIKSGKNKAILNSTIDLEKTDPEEEISKGQKANHKFFTEFSFYKGADLKNIMREKNQFIEISEQDYSEKHEKGTNNDSSIEQFVETYSDEEKTSDDNEVTPHKLSKLNIININKEKQTKNKIKIIEEEEIEAKYSKNKQERRMRNIKKSKLKVYRKKGK